MMRIRERQNDVADICASEAPRNLGGVVSATGRSCRQWARAIFDPCSPSPLGLGTSRTVKSNSVREFTATTDCHSCGGYPASEESDVRHVDQSDRRVAVELIELSPSFIPVHADRLPRCFTIDILTRDSAARDSPDYARSSCDSTRKTGRSSSRKGLASRTGRWFCWKMYFNAVGFTLRDLDDSGAGVRR